MTIGSFSLDWQKLTIKDLIAAGWMETLDAKTEKLFWTLEGMPGEFGLEGAKFAQGVIDRQDKLSQNND